jgi:hypothetical protein
MALCGAVHSHGAGALSNREIIIGDCKKATIMPRVARRGGNSETPEGARFSGSYRTVLKKLTESTADFVTKVGTLLASSKSDGETMQMLYYKRALAAGQSVQDLHASLAKYVEMGKRLGIMAELPAEFRAAHAAVHAALSEVSRSPKISKLPKLAAQVAALVAAAAAAAGPAAVAAVPAAPAAVVGGKRRAAARKVLGGAGDCARDTSGPVDAAGFAEIRADLERAGAALGGPAGDGAMDDAALAAELSALDAPAVQPEVQPAVAPVAPETAAVATGAVGGAARGRGRARKAPAKARA